MPRNRSIVAINYTAPEINHLAAELAATDLLKRYVRPYANQGRGWEGWLEGLPALGVSYRNTLGRRVMPEGFAAGQIREAATLADIAKAALGKVSGATSKDLREGLHWHIQQRVADVGAKEARDADAVVASYVVAKQAFEATAGCRILNYPIAHHRFIQKFVAEEALREPAFASTLPDWSSVPRWVEPRLDRECELADFILTGSTFARDSFVAEGIPMEKLVVIPYGADASRFSPPHHAMPEVRSNETALGLNVLFVGQLSQRKGLSYLLRAYDAFRGPDTRLTLVGDFYADVRVLTPYRDILQHVPHVPQAELVELYRQADLFVFPSLIEGLGMVVLEAMASGLPVITTPNGPGDLVRDGVDGFVVPIRDPEAITEKLEFLRANPERRAEMGRNARERAMTFTWGEYRRRAVACLTDALV